MSKLSAIVIACALSLLVGTGSVHAHAHLHSATPAVGSTVATPPTEIRLEFSEGFEPRFSGATVTTQSGAPVPVKVARDPDNETVMVATFTAPLAPGVYKVSWHVVSVDTHKTTGSFTFTIKP